MIGVTAVFALLPEKGPVASHVAEVTLELANRNVTVRGFPAWGATNQSPTARGTLPYVVACTERVDKALRLAIEATGARVVGVFPPDAFLIEAALVGELAKRGEVRWMEPFVRPKLLNDLAVEPASSGAIVSAASGKAC